jgi:four helix bundle protein
MTKREYDLKDRTLKFSKSLISFCSQIPKSHINNPIISQVVRSGTSIGANYAEADNAPTKKDFLNKLSLVLKEINETKYWLDVIREILEESKKTSADYLYEEVEELNLIFATIIKKTKDNLKSQSLDISH